MTPPLTTFVPDSSFIERLKYVPLAPELRKAHPRQGLLLIAMKTGHKYAYLVPSWLPLVLTAARNKGLSTGKLYRKHVMGRLQVKLSGEPLESAV